jgi:hypothetical protein
VAVVVAVRITTAKEMAGLAEKALWLSAIQFKE